MVHFGPAYEGNWSMIEGFPGYAIFDDGRVVNTDTGQQRATGLNQHGTRMVALWRDGFRVTASVSGLVARAFLPLGDLPEFFDTPVHLDGDKGNCHISNLCWRPRWFAVAYHKQFTKAQSHVRDLIALPVYLVETDEVFKQSFDAVVKYGILNVDIVKSAANHQPVFPHSFHFEFVTKDHPAYGTS